MTDREKVIKGLECLAQKQAPTANSCKDCGYINRPSFAICVKDIASDALALLKEQEDLGTELTNAVELIHKKNERIEKLMKEQEAVKPKSKVRHGASAQIQHFCGNCNTMLHGKPKFCSECGKGVLW